MGRTVKRVPLDFDWPLNKVWSGYVRSENLNPLPCPHCKNGASLAAQTLTDRWYGYSPFRPEERGSKPFRPDGPEAKAWAKRQIDHAPEYYGTGPVAHSREAVRICQLWNRKWLHHLNQDDVDALVAANRLMDLTHTWSSDTGWVPNGHRPTAEEVNRWSLFGFGHDSINQWVVVKAECKRLGQPYACEHCGGSGDVFADDDHRQAYESWEQTEPPEGNAWQMWETTSEGSPISPPCETAWQLAKWLAGTGAYTNGNDTATADEWLAMIQDGYAPSMVAIDGVVMSGVEAATLKKRRPTT